MLSLLSLSGVSLVFWGLKACSLSFDSFLCPFSGESLGNSGLTYPSFSLERFSFLSEGLFLKGKVCFLSMPAFLVGF